MRENKRLRQGVRVSGKHNGSYFTATVVRCLAGATPDQHRYDVRVEPGHGRLSGKILAAQFVYQCQPAGINWELVPTV